MNNLLDADCSFSSGRLQVPVHMASELWLHLLMKLITRLWSLVKYDFQVNMPKCDESKDFKKKSLLLSVHLENPEQKTTRQVWIWFQLWQFYSNITRLASTLLQLMQLWVHNQILYPVTGKQTAIIISLVRRNGIFRALSPWTSWNVADG